MSTKTSQIKALLQQANELSEYMDKLMVKMVAICDGLRKEGIV